ncbi:hypothetical protein TRFO_05012 [Tritrichomonas foetus]|uniref:Uncharacterized protein n=1 Tax=Tritrichomonas foetus TaxID=1144522 RepID=A0A1J4KDW6_9EUKA|nr:hypothetical protein TRFO_05012 [Tritrichomonas foetus]|eukprot:OHT07908.1 hypothetical protein TRFO_05012 [Tritrichomonas foetus]
MIKNFGFNAHEAIGWIRVCRPGSVIGPQQAFLIKYDSALHRPAPQTHVAPSIQHVVKSSKRPALSRPSDRINGNRAGLGTANSQSANSRTRATKTATASSPSRQRPKTTARPDHLRQNAKEKVSQQENGLLQIQAVSITPTVPQPRKLQRAQQHANSRKTPRK